MTIEQYIFDQDGTLYPKNSPLGIELSNKTKQWIIKSSGMDAHQFDGFVSNNPDFSSGLKKIGFGLKDWQHDVQLNMIEQVSQLLKKNNELVGYVNSLPSCNLVTFSCKLFSEEVIRALGLEGSFQQCHYVDNGNKKTAYKRILGFRAPGKTLVLGDNLKADLCPAAQLGMKTQLVDSNVNICSQNIF